MVQGQVVSDDTASLLLATKSNYQNILEGTHLPGVSYPSDLSTGLTSRRTIHKLAEQGRRNRINFALQEMAGLLPGAGAPGNKWKAAPRASADAEDREDSGGGGGEEKSKGGTAAASKASTVEQAIEYIKYLRAEVERANKRAEEAEEKLRERGEMDE